MSPWVQGTGTAALRALWSSGGTAYGPWVVTGAEHNAELVAHAGFDWVAIDAQHGFAHRGNVATLLRAVATAGATALVRVAENSAAEIGWALDAGANGVIVPLVETAEDARSAVAACRYPPAGRRSWGATRPALADAGYGTARGDAAALCIVMAETVEACRNIREVAAVEGVDGVFVGPADLAISAGVPPALDVTDPAVNAQIAAVLAACQEAGVVAGIYTGAADVAARRSAEGFRLVGVASDAQLLRDAATSVRAALHPTDKRTAVAAGPPQRG